MLNIYAKELIKIHLFNQYAPNAAKGWAANVDTRLSIQSKRSESHDPGRTNGLYL